VCGEDNRPHYYEFAIILGVLHSKIYLFSLDISRRLTNLSQESMLQNVPDTVKQMWSPVDCFVSGGPVFKH
jgi:hypothetical protein